MTVDPGLSAVLDALTAHARRIILDHMEPDTCIASTRIGIDALDYFGVRAEPIPLTALVINAEAAAMLSGGKTLAEVAEIMAAIPVHRAGGPWTIGLGTGLSNTGVGHVAIALPSERILIDLSMDQINRPHKGIVFEPFWTVIDNERWWQQETPRTEVVTADGCHVVWDTDVIDALDYTRSPNWKRRSSHLPAGTFAKITGQVIREMRRDLGR